MIVSTGEKRCPKKGEWYLGSNGIWHKAYFDWTANPNVEIGIELTPDEERYYTQFKKDPKAFISLYSKLIYRERDLERENQRLKVQIEELDCEHDSLSDENDRLVAENLLLLKGIEIATQAMNEFADRQDLYRKFITTLSCSANFTDLIVKFQREAAVNSAGMSLVNEFKEVRKIFNV